MQTLTQSDIMQIHDASVDILGRVGVAFNHEEALNIFKTKGFKVEGQTVFMTEKNIRQALASIPSHFMLSARNPEKSVQVDADSFVAAPGYGAPYVVTTSGERQKGSLQDYENFCKLVHTSKQIDVTGYLMVEPCDRPPKLAYLDMMRSNIVLCDKPFMCSTASKQAVEDSLEMAAIVFGGRQKIQDHPVVIGLINSQSPLQFTQKMTGSLIALARCGQPCIISSVIMAGLSGPVNLAGALTLQNAEILAGLILAQLVRAGTPAVYGSASAPVDMKTGALAIGAPELSIIISATVQMARFYNLPCRCGGGLTDAHIPDAQAALESAFSLSAAVRSGANFILHACGILSSFMAISYAKFVLDEEALAMTRRMMVPVEVSDDTLSLTSIKEVNIGGQYLTQPKTIELCWNEFFIPEIMKRKNYPRWQGDGCKRIDEIASDAVDRRLSEYQKPDLDSAVASRLSEFVAKREQEIM
ncbi:MAG: trimethylamine methyltransferase family protein [Desulfobacterales bacterium]|jgi:trimethylamine--corrinoid protein Co-methyltransferase